MSLSNFYRGYIIFFLGLYGCAQNTTTTYTQQDILNLYQTVQHFDEETHYGVRVKSANCNFQILINDRIVFKTRKNEKGLVLNGAYAPINYGILKAGEQQITIKMLPPVIDKKTEEKYTELGNAQLEVEILADDFVDGKSTGEYGIYEWKSPTEMKHIPNRGEIPYFTQPELPYYEHKDVFEAEYIEYDIPGWQNSVVIKPRNQQELEKLTKEVVAAYEELRLLMNNKDLDGMANKLYNSFKVESQQLYFDEFDIEEQWNKYIVPHSHNGFKMMPLENYKLVIYGNGKLVGLELKGPKYEGSPALWSQHNESTETKKYTNSILFYGFLLHRPTVFSKLEWI